MTLEGKPKLFFFSVLTVSLCLNVAFFVFKNLHETSSASMANDDLKKHTSLEKKQISICKKELKKCSRRNSGEFFVRYLKLANKVSPESFQEESSDTEKEMLTKEALLNEIALEGVKFEWKKDLNEASRGLKKHLANVKEQEESVQEAIDGFSSILELDEKEVALLEERYRALRFSRLNKIEEFAKGDLVNFESVYYEIEQFFEDENQLIEELYGLEARNKLNQKKYKDRLNFLAAIATIGDVSWDELPSLDEL